MPITVYFIKGRNYKNNKTKLITNFQSIKHFLLQRNFNYIVIINIIQSLPFWFLSNILDEHSTESLSYVVMLTIEITNFSYLTVYR